MKDKRTWLSFFFCIIPPILFEVWFRLLVLDTKASILPVVGYAFFVGSIIYFFTRLFRDNVGKVVFCICNSLLAIYFMIQIVYYDIFQVFFSFASMFTVGLDALQFQAEIYSSISANALQLLLYILTTIVSCLPFCYFCHWEKSNWKKALINSGLLVFVFLCFRLLLFLCGTKEMTAHYLYTKEWSQAVGAEKLGMLVVAKKDILSLLGVHSNGNELEDIVIIQRPTVVTPGLVATDTPSPTKTEVVQQITLTPTPTKTLIDTSPNILNIDFETLAKAEPKEEIRTIHRYFAHEEYTLKNEYTGMFEGYNLIFITAEGFAPYAMVDGLTPTLQKLSSEGFVFKNYYSPIWLTSTIDGEFANTTGLLPDDISSLKRMYPHGMPLALGNRFRALGYIAKAYHNHSDTYYDRHKIYPVMGYDYKGRSGIGMPKRKNGEYFWPGSDEIMMQLTTDEYIHTEPFHVYYMTVSGHLEYNFVGNQMAMANEDVVKHLPYSDHARAYIACNYELEKGLTHLIEQLEQAGIADRTVIVLATDHYPYGLKKEAIDELVGHEVDKKFELYKSTLIIWSGSIKEPIEVEKYCSSIDIVPTIANLFGLNYDSRLHMGKDILSTSEGLVMFNDKSFITDRLMYYAPTQEITYLTKEEIPKNYVETMKQIVKNRFNISKGIIDLGYYSYLPSIEEIE